ncbi:glycosyltransferase [Microbacterium sp.]|uniref:glycosyltransferase n=1 Tax=Microbacterium sp. TaxID=51671 RepID=UPI003A837614
MTAILRIVLDQVTELVDTDLAVASQDLARALTATSPHGCDVEALVPAGSATRHAASQAVPGLRGVTALTLRRRELAAAWQLGVPVGVPGGMIHSPTLMAPLVRHDRTHDHDQTVVTVWDLRAWEHPVELPKPVVLWHRAMLKRAARYADAVVVPTHAAAARVAELAPLGDRIRVIAGAAPERFAVPTDDVGRRRDLQLPDGYLLVTGGLEPSGGVVDAFSALAVAGIETPVVVIDVPDEAVAEVAQAAVSAGLSDSAVQVRGALDAHDRAAVYGAAVALIAPAVRTDFPWRVVEALTLGVPVVAADTAQHAEVILDGGLLADPTDPEAFGARLREALASTEAIDRLAVLAGDRGRVFSWAGAAELVWQLHADL